MTDASGSRSTRLFLTAGIALPFLYFGTVIVASLFYPGYSHVTQYASELGSATARWPLIFNVGIFLSGLAAIAAGAGLFQGLAAAGLKPLVPALVGLSVALLGVSLLFGALFPMPDLRHGGFGLGMAIHFGPLLGAAALWPRRNLRLFTWSLIATFLLMATLFVVMMGVGHLVTRANVGVYQRLYALTMFPWIGFASALVRAGKAADGQPAPA